jgi:hypothetical protein
LTEAFASSAPAVSTCLRRPRHENRAPSRRSS